MRSWLEQRTGLISFVWDFLKDPIPKSVGWRNTLGSVVGAFLLIQILSGVLLALYYVPHPEAAYDSVEYIESEVAAGGFVRALHYWGASFVMVALFLHMCRVFFSGAYKKPREMTWLAGVVLFGVVTALAFTGQLLPWNQMGYWAANVGVEIASSAPLVGDMVKQVILAGESIGALTLTRFYTAHAIVLPALLGVMVVLHLYLLRRHGPTRPASDSSDGTEPFFPLQMARDMAAISVGLIALAYVAWRFGGPDSPVADPTDTSYVPRPEWYFLAHYELLRFTPGPLKLLTTFVVPTLFGVVMIALPWLDRGPTTAFRERRAIVAIGSVVIAGIVGLTAYGLANLPEEEGGEAVAAEEAYDPVEAGRRMFRQERCMTCHTVRGRGRDIGPDLTYVGAQLQEDYLRAWLKEPTRFVPDTQMPAVEVRGQDFDALVAYLMSLNEMP